MLRRGFGWDRRLCLTRRLGKAIRGSQLLTHSFRVQAISLWTVFLSGVIATDANLLYLIQYISFHTRNSILIFI
jgi:hypothetical protein